jgi:hypothetical protein
MAAHPTFPAAELESVCRVLADTDNGLSGSEIGHLLTQQGIEDPAPDLTKWKRLTEQDALDLLTMASFCHRRLDAAARTPRTT